VQKVTVKVKTLENFRGELPKYETFGASGLDVRACLDQAIILEPGQRMAIPTGLSVEIPMGYEIQVRPRSGWALKEGMSVLNTPGTVDADYRGEIKIILVNLGNKSVKIQDQDRIAQLVLCPVIQLEWQPVDSLTLSDRGAGGFGSTGKD
jgi:dUTP pyrophosphatase